MGSRKDLHGRLDYYNQLIQATILTHQNPVTGLIAQRGNHAWVRDNVYGILAVWGLALAYRKFADTDEQRAMSYELEQRVVKLMRGTLMCMMRQIDKVEKFKKTQCVDDALHAKYNAENGSVAAGDKKWGHLQVDATSLFVLMLAQMTASGLKIIFTTDEVDFVQNLVFYIGSAYRIRDYGIWERGDKTNHGLPELNASSIGIAKAALEAISSLDLFGSHGGPASVIHVMPDQIKQCEVVLQSMLPRESSSKEIGAATLSVISFPAFAIADDELVRITRNEIITKLQGRYGCRRFLRDGYMTVREDHSRLHYEPAELKAFENIECEWPLFFAYLIIDGVFRDDIGQVDCYNGLLADILVFDDYGNKLMPELYYVEADKVEMEYQNPHSQTRVPGPHVPHIWGQSLYILSCLLCEELITPGEIDPLNRRHVVLPNPELVVQVALLAEDDNVRQELNNEGIIADTPSSLKQIEVFPPRMLALAYQHLGRNGKLGLSGRPLQLTGLISTSSFYRIFDSVVAFTPQFLDYKQFYLCLDNELLVNDIETDIGSLQAHWRLTGRPTITLPITATMLSVEPGSDRPWIIKLITKMQLGYINGVRVRLGKLNDFLSTSCVKSLDFLETHFSGKLYLQFNYLDTFAPPKVLGSGATTPERNLSIPTIIRSTYSSNTSLLGDKDQRLVDVIGQGLQKRHRPWSLLAKATPSLPQDLDADVSDLLLKLENEISLQELAITLNSLLDKRGANFVVDLPSRLVTTVGDLIDDLYKQVCDLKLWSLVRHAAGLLNKRVENLAESVTDIIVHQKLLTVGYPPAIREETITGPLPPDELQKIILTACGDDIRASVITQEFLIYLAMFMRTEPQLFKEMLRIRVGLIMEVMATEVANSLECTGDEASEYFVNMSPFEMKHLLHQILSGREFAVAGVTEEENVHSISRKQSIRNKSISILPLDQTASLHPDSRYTSSFKAASKRKISDVPHRLLTTNSTDSDNPSDFDRPGQWMRRRRIDGALNRVPENFYQYVWRVLEKCHGISIGGYVLPQYPIIQEMTPNELKFAICVETALNRIPHPEYRQLVVEALMVLGKVVEIEPIQTLGGIIDMNYIVHQANELFLEDQTRVDNIDYPVQELEGAENICCDFYDSAPAGRFGTITYLSKVILKRLDCHNTTDCIIS
ncbi:uncharacterized protein TRIADDRAFT_25466 [Trichoplax adhaerens]|uniref:Phosphorylase b kinase regulatory subunit n=1 Tax=Trichoplax adhaerens TaxID=10228 RepID=B3RXC8_TRIAD|nr:hypothetical protein TRIADDRAFT_25466 [Trichoplax adhaerens]EDV24395.1 hypothetical protein TRIADDRAFT_25466 [Trichoplax adhaerens]|eukprot:XP_002112285.1 hypothetical protein TRIADDRAFT_25466 [Trichoplax adhaerens]